MKKIFLSAATMIVTRFIMRVVDRIKHPEQVLKEDTYRAMRDARKQWLREHQPKRPVAEVDAQLMRLDPSAVLASIGTVSELEAALRPCRSVDKDDAMALAPRRFA